MQKSVNRLFTQFQPNNYHLALALDEKQQFFFGRVIITGKKVGRPSKRLTFHANGLRVTRASITHHSKKATVAVDIARINHHKSFHEVRLHSDAQMFPGDYEVMMEFQAPITAAMTGIYPSHYKDGSEEKTMYATQFESHHAREAFPCIDEPEAKATFALTMITDATHEVLSNMPVASESPISSKDLLATKVANQSPLKVTTFETSPRMSSYLLAFVAGNIHKKSGTTKTGTEVNIWATSIQPLSSLDFALDVAIKSIEYFEDYFNVPYPLAKADHIALPDFSSGAMENWGLITYRERLLLAYDGDTSQSSKEQIALVIAHETSHQWFGNLVTMRWWDNLWLNESFANMMEYAAVDSMFPEWNVWDTFAASEGLSSLRRDALYGVQAVQTAVHHPDEISSLFDPSIVYAKGGRLLHMLKQYIGEEAFREGLRAYFTQHAYANTEAHDLWNAFSKTSGKDIDAFMTPWLTRSGYPLVQVGLEGNRLHITQQHFLDNPKKADASLLWPLPTFSPTSHVPEVLSKPSLTLQGHFDSTLIDPNAYGHYLVNYTTENLKENIRSKVADGSLSVSGRLLLLNSKAMVAKAGYDSYGSVLEFLSAYTDETSEPVWDMIALVQGELRRFIDQDPAIEARAKALSKKLATNLYHLLGWEEQQGEPSANTKLRALIIGMMVYGEDEDATNEALRRYALWTTGNETSVPSELRALILSVPVRTGDTVAFSELIKKHDATTNSDLKGDLCDALTSTKKSEQATVLLGRLKDKKLVKPQDVDRWLVSLMRNRYTRDVAWQWMVDNWQWLEHTFKNDKSYDYLPRYAATCVNTRAYEQKFKDLFDDKVEQPLLRRNIQLGYEEIESRLQWLERDITSVQAYFGT
jgi:aminopeptidase N